MRDSIYSIYSETKNIFEANFKSGDPNHGTPSGHLRFSTRGEHSALDDRAAPSWPPDRRRAPSFRPNCFRPTGFGPKFFVKFISSNPIRLG